MEPQPPPPAAPATPAAPVPPVPPAAAPATRDARPLAAVLGVVLLLVVGLGTAAFGGLVLLLGTEIRAGSTEATVVTATGGFSVVFGILAFVAAVGVWQGRGWGWVLGVVVAAVGLLGVTIAILTSSPQVPLLVGLGMFVGLLACLLAPGVRARSGIG